VEGEEHLEEEVAGDFAEGGGFGSEDNQSLGSGSDGTDSDDDEEDDEDDLIDIPKPGHSFATLRNRTSRASLLSLPSPTVSRDNALKASRNYGSMRSLCGSIALSTITHFVLIIAELSCFYSWNLNSQ